MKKHNYQYDNDSSLLLAMEKSMKKENERGRKGSFLLPALLLALSLSVVAGLLLFAK